MRQKVLIVGLSLFLLLSLVASAVAAPPYPEGPPSAGGPEPTDVLRLPQARQPKPMDQPNIKDYLRNRERQRLLEAGQFAEAEALSLTADDRVLVILVEFNGTDTFTWNPGDEWDPLGMADPNEAVYDDDGNLVVGDCSNIITQTMTFTYTGPLHNELPRPLSAEDRSGDSIWTEDFSPGWFEGFMFGDGIVFDYTRQDGSVVFEDFTGESVKDYFLDISGGDYEIAGDVIGWLQVPHSTWWYGADQCPGRRSPYDANTASAGAIPGAGSSRSFVKDALDAVNAAYPDFDWAQYDRDGDGLIDRLWIVHSGYGEEDATEMLNRTGYGESALWSHSASVSPVYEVAPGIAAGPYIMMPENGGIGVFAHEYAHNLGADDLYAYDQGNTSTGFWALQSDDWTGYPIGYEPPAPDPWHLDNWGWLDPMIITDTEMEYTFTLGQASRFPGGEDLYRGGKIILPDGILGLPVPVWQGDFYWWGNQVDLANAMMTTKDPIAIPAGAAAATLAFDLVYDIEDEWDFLWIQASEDGTTWDTLTNENTQCEHDPGWVGGLYGFPEDLCGAGIGGFYGYNANWPDPEMQEFDLSAYAGKSVWLRWWFMTDWATHYTGVFVDNVKVMADEAVLFTDDAESGDDMWVYAEPWLRNDGTQTFSHNFYLQWRNVNDNGGYDSALGDERWRFGPANTGMLVWYNNNFYSANEIWQYWFDGPSIGPKGRMLVVESQPEPYRDPDMVAMGFDNEGGNLTSRGQMRDAPFTLADTVPFDHTDPYRAGAQEHSYPGRPAVSAFHDSMGYYPGAEFVRRGAGYPATQFKWVTKAWDVSAVVPATADYAFKAPGYTGNQEFRFNCTPYTSGPYAGLLGCYWLGAGTGLGYDGGSGNPGDSMAQYGWHVELVEEAEDHTWATVRVWNAMEAVNDELMAEPAAAAYGEQVDYTYKLHQNIGSPIFALVVVPLDTSLVQYVPDSAWGGAMPLPSGVSAAQAAAAFAEGGQGALADLASSQAGEIGSVAWVGGDVATGEGGGEFGFGVKVMTPVAGTIELPAMVYNNQSAVQTTEGQPVDIISRQIFLPLVFKEAMHTVEKRFTILHTNDFHGYLETDYRGRGGSAYMASVIGDVREEVGEDYVFLIDAGDAYLGAAPISQLLLGESTIDIYNLLGYDVGAFGNHDFDKGQEVLAERVAQSEFPWLGANVVLEGTDWEYPEWAKPYVILEKGGVKLGVLGLDTDETPQVTLKGTTDGLVFKDLTETILHYYDEVLDQADAMVVVIHMGTDDSGPFKGLQTVAQELIDAGKPVDLMIGGHQHQPLEEPLMVGDTAIIQAGYYGRWLGRADIVVNPAEKSLALENYELITINNELPADPEIEARVAYWAEQVAPFVTKFVGLTNVDLIRDYNRESNMGNLVADSMLWKADEYDDGEVNGSVDIAFTNPGGLRADIQIPVGATTPYTVTWGDTFNVLPFANTLYLMDLTGAQIQELLDQAASLYKGILQTSGATWTWYNDCDCAAPTQWGAYDTKVGGEALDPDKVYRVVTNNFLAPGGDGWVTFAEGTNRWDTYFDMQEGLNEYIEMYNDTVGPIDAEVEGRIVKLDKLVTILHTNDTHGVWQATDYRGTLEGFEYLATLIKQEREKAPNALLLDAGDTFQGNAFAQYFRNDTPNPIAGGLNMLDYDAMVLGNHEFNFGPETFATMLGQLDFPILGSANLDDDGSYGFINDNVEDYITLDVDGVDVLIFGLTNSRVPRYELPSNIEGLTFYPATDTAKVLVPTLLAEEDPDLLIALNHIGYSPYAGEEDSDLLIAERVPGIDVIISAHSHTKLDPAVLVTSEANPEGTLIAQAERYAIWLGKVNVGLVDDGAGGYDVVMREGHLIPAGSAEVDPELHAYLEPFLAALDAYTSQEIGQTTVPLDALEAYTEETTGANLQVDAAVFELDANGIDTDFYLSGAMSNRKVADGATPQDPVTLTVNDMYTLMPYENSLVVMEMNGPQLKTVLERAYRNWYYYNYVDGYGGYSHYTTCMLDINEGGVITYDDTYPNLPDGNNVVSLVVGGQPIDFGDAATYYNVGTVNYLAAGSCNFNDDGVTLWPLDQTVADTQFYVRDAVIDYIQDQGTVSPEIEGRLVWQ